MQHTFQDPSRLIPSYALLGRIRLSSSMSGLESAEQAMNIWGGSSSRFLGALI